MTAKRMLATTIGQIAVGVQSERVAKSDAISAGCCFLPIYSARPERRVQQLLYTSENLRAVVDEWERFWQLDAPSHLTPIRTHGGVL